MNNTISKQYRAILYEALLTYTSYHTWLLIIITLCTSICINLFNIIFHTTSNLLSINILDPFHLISWIIIFQISLEFQNKYDHNKYIPSYILFNNIYYVIFAKFIIALLLIITDIFIYYLPPSTILLTQSHIDIMNICDKYITILNQYLIAIYIAFLTIITNILTRKIKIAIIITILIVLICYKFTNSANNILYNNQNPM